MNSAAQLNAIFISCSFVKTRNIEYEQDATGPGLVAQLVIVVLILQGCCPVPGWAHTRIKQ